MRKNKMAALGLAFAMAITAVGCASSSESNKDNTTEAEKASSVEAETTVHDTTEAVTETAAPETTKSAETTVAETEKETETETEPADKGFEFDQNSFPVLDGSTSTKPMAVAVRSLLLGESRDDADKEMEFHKTSASFNYLINGETDMLIVAQPSDEVFDMMKEAEFEYDMEAFAFEGLVFVCNKNNPVDSLTSQQIIDIYTGKITNWKEVGGNDEEIVPVQRNHSSGSQVMMDHLVMQGNEMMEVPTKLMPAGMDELIELVESYDNSSNALGYTPYYYATAMGMADKLKILKVNDVMPSHETIKSREYPYINPYYVVIAKDKEEDSEARILYDWILSKDGQKLTELEGYVPAIADPEESLVNVDWNKYEKVEEEKYTRLSADSMPDFVPSDDYETVFPYCGEIVRYVFPEQFEDPDNEDFTSYHEKYGFCSKKGEILTDPCFDSVGVYDYFYLVYMGEEDKCGFISKSGDKYTGCIYDIYYEFDINNNIYAYKSEDQTETVFSADLEILYEGPSIRALLAQDRVVDHDDKLYNPLTGEKLCDYRIRIGSDYFARICPELTIDNKAYLAECGPQEYCLVDIDGNELTDHYSEYIPSDRRRSVSDCPFFIARKEGMNYFDVINGNGEIINTIFTSDKSDIIICDDYYMVLKGVNYNLYNKESDLVANDLETYGWFISAGSDCPFVFGKNYDFINGEFVDLKRELIDPLTKKSFDYGEYFEDNNIQGLRKGESIYFYDNHKVIQCSNDLEFLCEKINIGTDSWLDIVEITDQKSKKNYILLKYQGDKKIEIRNAETFELILTIPYTNYGSVEMIDDGLVYYINGGTYDIDHDNYTKIFSLEEPENTVFLYRALVSENGID